jgi:hypothetical protein
MKAFGYIKKKHGREGLVELSQVTIRATPELLREVAAFLIHCAQDMDKHHERFGHRHIQDVLKSWRTEEPERPDVIVAAPSLGTAQPGGSSGRRDSASVGVRARSARRH